MNGNNQPNVHSISLFINFPLKKILVFFCKLFSLRGPEDMEVARGLNLFLHQPKVDFFKERNEKLCQLKMEAKFILKRLYFSLGGALKQESSSCTA